MAATTDLHLRKGPPSAVAGANPESVCRHLRVEELRRQIAQGTYKVYPQRLALKILVQALRNRT